MWIYIESQVTNKDLRKLMRRYLCCIWTGRSERDTFSVEASIGHEVRRADTLAPLWDVILYRQEKVISSMETR